MATAATLLTEALIPTGKPAASGKGASAQSSSASPFASPFASLLAEGSFVQLPGVAALETAPSLATLFATGRVAAALDGEDGFADSAFNVIPLFDTTALTTPALVAPVPGLGLGVASQNTNGASSDTPIVAPTGDSLAASALAPVAGRSANLIPTSLTDSPQTTPARTAPGRQDPADGHVVGPQQAHKGVTAADVMAEIAQLDPAPAADAAKAAPVTPAANRPSAQLATPAAAASSIADGQAAREGEASDPRVTSQIVQSGAPRPSTEGRAVASRAAAKPTTGLGAALSGDVAMAAMAVETPRPNSNKPGAARTANSAPGVSETPANPTIGTPATPNKPQLVTAQGSRPSIPPGLTFDPLALGAVGDEAPTAPRVALDARIDSLPPTAQPVRGGEAAGPVDRTATMPAPAPTLPPSEQVALQLRHAVAKGVDRISIQLNPASLGSIDITLEVTAGSRVVVTVVADRADTLDLLRADARGLERALQEAGLRTDSGSLNFNLRGDGNGASQKNSAADNDLDDGAPTGDPDDDSDAAAETPETPAQQASNQALDIEV